jgi:hypothetical protein
MRLIQEEFAFDGYLDNGLEALIMGMGPWWPLWEKSRTRERLGEADAAHGAIGMEGTWVPLICLYTRARTAGAAHRVGTQEPQGGRGSPSPHHACHRPQDHFFFMKSQGTRNVPLPAS